MEGLVIPQRIPEWANCGLVDDTNYTLVPEEVDRAAVDRVLWEGDNLYRIGFLPAVLAWVALDYTDDICNQCAALRLNFKEQVRKIRTLAKEFNEYFNNDEMDKVNELNGIGLQEQFEPIIKELRDEIKQHIHYMLPMLPDAMLYFYGSVYMAMFAFRALFAYAFECDKYLDKRIKTFGNRSVVLPHTRSIYRILPTFLGKYKDMIQPRDLDNYSQRLVKFVKSADFVNEHNSKF
jgi:hypothetical protein